jgi:hypothetical protein
LVVLSQAATAQDSVLWDESLFLLKTVPEETREDWRVGFSSFQPVFLTKDNRYLLNSVPLLLREELRSLSVHRLSDQELEARRSEIVKMQIHDYLQDLKEIENEEKELLLSRDTDPYYSQTVRKTLVELARKKTALKEAVQWLEKLPREQVVLGAEKPVVFAEGDESGTLLFSPQFSPAGLAKRENLDFLVWGTIEEIQGYLFVKIHGFHTVLGREVYTYESGGSADELPIILDEAIGGLAEQILGRRWASLEVVPRPGTSSVVVNEIFRGIGATRMRFLEPGRATVLVTTPGYIEERREVVLAPYEHRSIEIELEQKETLAITLNTNPEGADVYLDSQWFGITPLELDLLQADQRLLLKKEGFKDLVFDIEETTPRYVEFDLRRKILDELQWQERKRDTFYTSLGIWALSLPFPIFLYGYAVDNARAANRATVGTDEYNKFRRNMELTYAGYFATLFVSVTLFVKMLINMLEYVDFVDYASQQSVELE